MKARIDETQQKSKCRLYSDRDETINHIISECSKLAQKDDWVGKGIHWDTCKEFIFDHTNKCYMHNPASVQENDTHKHLRIFDMQTNHLISAGRPDLIMITKKRICLFSTLLSLLTTAKNVKRRISTSTYLGNWKKTMEHEGDIYTNCDWYFCYSN